MRICQKAKHNDSTQGISLFVVMSALLVLSALVLSTTTLILTPTYIAANSTRIVEDRLAYRSAISVLRLVIRNEVADGLTKAPTENLRMDGGIFRFNLFGQQRAFVLQDTNGLIDVNSASLSLIKAFLQNVGLTTMIPQVIKLREIDPLNSVNAFLKIVAPDAQNREIVSNFLTIRSGQRRINGQTAPIELLTILSGHDGLREQLLPRVDQRFLRTRSVSLISVREISAD